MSISNPTPVTNEAQTASLESSERAITNGFKLIADTMTDLAELPKQPVLEVISHGSFTTPYGTISIIDNSRLSR